MPIMSFSISEQLKRLIQTIVEKNKAFKNQSGFVRAALSNYINSAEAQIDVNDEIDATEYKVNGQILISFKNDEKQQKILKDIFNAEVKHTDSIQSFQMFTQGLNSTACTYSFQGNIFEFRALVDELDSVQDIEQIRYIIN
nr:hypothetical protein [Candidatus Sigynarchaeota archaeon]